MSDTPLSSDIQYQSTPAKSGFWDKYLGLIIQLFLFTVLMVAAALTVPIFYNPRNWEMLFKQCVPFYIMGLALVLSTRLKGIDLTAGAVFAASGWVFASYANENMVVPGLALALLLGLALGAVNGTIQTVIRVPSAPLTMAISAAVTFVITLLVGWFTGSLWNGRSVVVQIAGADLSAVGAVSLIAALVIVLALLYFTKLGAEGPVQKRHVFMAYAGSSLIFVLAACYMVMRLQMGSPHLAGSADILYLLFIAGAILISRSAKVRILPVACALLAALNWSMLSNIFALMGMDIFTQNIFQLILTAATIIPAFIVQRRSRTRL